MGKRTKKEEKSAAQLPMVQSSGPVEVVKGPLDWLSSDNPEFWEKFILGGKSRSGVKVNAITAMQSSVVFACVRMLSQDLAKLRPYLRWMYNDGTKVPEREHELARLLRRPNGWQSWFEFASQMQVGLVLRGNAYAAIIRDARGKAISLFPLNPDSIALWESPDGALFWQVSRTGYFEKAQLEYFDKFGLLIPYESVLHLTDMRPIRGIQGLDAILSSRESVGLSIAQEQLASTWTGNKATPAGILSTESRLSPGEADRMEKAWKNLHSGVQNAGKTAVFERGLKWIPLSMTASDMEFLASRRYQLEEIARIFRIPLHMLGASSDKNTAAKTTDKAGQDYINLTLSTYTEIWKQKLAMFFGLYDEADNSRELELAWDYDILVKADIATRVSTAKQAVNGSLWTPDEGRIYLDMNPKNTPESSRLLFPANSTPFGSQASGDAPDGAGRPTEGEENA